MKRKVMNSILIILFVIVLCSNLSGQEVFGFSYEYEYFPYSKIAEPDSANIEDLEIQTNSQSFGAAFPLMFAQGKIIVLNSINYKRVDFSYKNQPAGGIDVKQAQSIEYTAFMIDSLSAKWSMVAVITPGLASDFETKITADDFTFQGVFGFLRRFSEKFSLGSGIAYTREFGPSIPLPFIYFEWEILPKLNAKGLLPQNLDLIYNFNPNIDFGLTLGVAGNRYHGNPNTFDVGNPQMEYSEGTISPKVQIHFAQMFHLNLEGGYTFYRNFEFLDGDHSEESYDMENSAYFRANIVLGM